MDSVRERQFNLDFIGMGAARCGTTWVARVLQAHPQVYLPPKKELHYFNKDRFYRPDLSGYAAYFRDASPGAVLGEFTPRYMLYPHVIERVWQAFPETKVLVCLRHPVDRALSQYKFFRYVKRKEPEADFRNALEGLYREDYIDKSLYAAPLKRLIECFSRERVLVLFYEDIQEYPQEVTGRLCSFLGIDTDHHPDVVTRRVNASTSDAPLPPDWWMAARYRAEYWRRQQKIRRSKLLKQVLWTLEPYVKSARVQKDARAVTPEDRRAILDQYFMRDIEAVETLLEVDLSHWK